MFASTSLPQWHQPPSRESLFSAGSAGPFAQLPPPSTYPPPNSVYTYSQPPDLSEDEEATMTRRTKEEFPGMAALGVYAAKIKGDGNCLFAALSDQTYGETKEHRGVRARVIEHMRNNEDHYKAFLSVNVGGGTRRNPKRKNVGGAPVDLAAPSQEEIDVAFEKKLTEMSKGGTWGDNAEITAFAQAYNVNVVVFQHGYRYSITPNGETSNDLPSVYIAHHTWEHFSSVRNIDGPHTGLPQVTLKDSAIEKQKKAEPATTGAAQPWQVDISETTLPHVTDEAPIKLPITQTGSNLNDAVNSLTDTASRSPSSSQGSDSSSPAATPSELSTNTDEDKSSRARVKPYKITKANLHRRKLMTGHERKELAKRAQNSARIARLEAAAVSSTTSVDSAAGVELPLRVINV